MARKVSQEINWKPRRQRNIEVLARVAHLQKNLPSVVRDVFAGDESRVEPVPPDAVDLPKKSKFAVLLWEPRSQEGNP
ncbi:MAG: hypothetical protein HZA92_02400 [Verrucomicrobia bacterium]|nr:hypothetical protein [Verrucomicrobiota bacterium]